MKGNNTATDNQAHSRFDGVDGWRGVACILVLFTHTGFAFGWSPFVIWGFCGVHIFFVLSGFLLFLPFCEAILHRRKFPQIGRFFLRRGLRIFPAYCLALFIFTGLRYITNQSPPSASSFLIHFMLVFNWFDPSEFFAVSAVFWSLAVEAQFYVLLPICTWGGQRIFKDKPKTALLGVVAFFVIVGLTSRAVEFLASTSFTTEHPEWPRFRFVTSFLDFFACGMVVAYFYIVYGQKNPLSRPLSWLLMLTGFVVLLSANYYCTLQANGDWMCSGDFGFMVAFGPAVCIGIAAIFLGTVSAKKNLICRVLESKPLRFIGKVSYGVYLFHFLVQLPMFKVLPLSFISNGQLRCFCWGLISLGPTLVIAALVFRFVEEPFIRLSKKY